MIIGEFTVKKVLMGYIAEDEDLLLALQKLAKENDIRAGRIEILGAVKEANVGYFNYKSKEFEFTKYRKILNVVSCHGTFTEKDGEPYVHLHVAFSDHDGKMYGGHLTEGTIVKSSEFTIAIYEGDTAKRVFDPESGLTILQ